MFIQKNIIDNIIEIDNNIIETIKCLQKKYYKTKNKKPLIVELYKEFVDTFNKLKSLDDSNKSDDSDIGSD
jgi:hypothetical protein